MCCSELPTPSDQLAGGLGLRAVAAGQCEPGAIRGSELSAFPVPPATPKSDVSQAKSGGKGKCKRPASIELIRAGKDDESARAERADKPLGSADSCPGSALGGSWVAKAATGLIVDTLFNLTAIVDVRFAELIDDATLWTDWPTSVCSRADSRNGQRALGENALLCRLAAVLSEQPQTNGITHSHSSPTYLPVACGRRLGGRRSREEIDLGLAWAWKLTVGLLRLEEATQKVRDFRSPRLFVVKEAL